MAAHAIQSSGDKPGAPVPATGGTKLHITLVMAGYQGSGKSSLVWRLLNKGKEFNYKLPVTNGLDVCTLLL